MDYSPIPSKLFIGSHPRAVDDTERLRQESAATAVLNCRRTKMEMLAKLKPDILLLDVRMPEKDGLSVLEEVNFDSLPTRVIVLTAAEDDRDMLIGTMRLGARGVVLKQSASDLLLKSIRKVHDGEIWLDNRITTEVIDAFKKSAGAGQRHEKPLLSGREKEIVQLVAQGFRNREIGEKITSTTFLTSSECLTDLNSRYTSSTID
jgi:DNA-binding NarL/FixJ family response regulator